MVAIYCAVKSYVCKWHGMRFSADSSFVTFRKLACAAKIALKIFIGIGSKIMVCFNTGFSSVFVCKNFAFVFPTCN